MMIDFKNNQETKVCPQCRRSFSVIRRKDGKVQGCLFCQVPLVDPRGCK